MADKPLVNGNNHRAIVEDIQSHADALRTISRNLLAELEPIHHRLDPKILQLVRSQADHVMAILLLTKDGQRLIETARNGVTGVVEAKLLEVVEKITEIQGRLEVLEDAQRDGLPDELRDIVAKSEK